MKKKVLAMTFAALMLFTTAVSAGSEAKTIEVIPNPMTLLVNEEAIEEQFFEHEGKIYVPLSLLEKLESINVEISPQGTVLSINDSRDSIPYKYPEELYVQAIQYAYDAMSIDLIEKYVPHYQALGYLMYEVFVIAYCGNYDLAVKFYEECLDMFNLQYDNYIDAYNNLYYDTSTDSDFALELIWYANNRIMKAAENALTYLAKYLNTVQRNAPDANSYLDTFLSRYFTYNEEWTMAQELYISFNTAYSYIYFDVSKEEKSLIELIQDDFWHRTEEVLGETWRKKYDKEKVKYEDYEFSTDKLPKVTYKQN